MRGARLLDRKTNSVVQAEVISEVTAGDLIEVEGIWRKYREAARMRVIRNGLPVPEHNHWRWDRKAHDLQFTAYRCLAVRHKEEIQGLAMVSILGQAGRSAADKRKPVLYVKYIETAPWNLRDYVGEKARYGGVGTSLIVAAIELSVEEGMRGRIGLHSLPQSERFYGSFMEDLGVDRHVEGLRYFELSEAAARAFMTRGDQ